MWRSCFFFAFWLLFRMSWLQEVVGMVAGMEVSLFGEWSRCLEDWCVGGGRLMCCCCCCCEAGKLGAPWLVELGRG